MTPPTFEIVAVYNGVSRTKSSALSARESCAVAAAAENVLVSTGAVADAGGVVAVGVAGPEAAEGASGVDSGAFRGAYSDVKRYITAIDKTKARMTRFSI